MADKRTPKEVIDNFRAVYRILSALERAMDVEEFSLSEHIGADKLGISQERWLKYIEMLCDSGYIKNARVEDSIGGKYLDEDNPCITLKGLEYLQENSIMQYMYRLAKGIKDITPGL